MGQRYNHGSFLDVVCSHVCSDKYLARLEGTPLKISGRSFCTSSFLILCSQILSAQAFHVPNSTPQLRETSGLCLGFSGLDKPGISL